MKKATAIIFTFLLLYSFKNKKVKIFNLLDIEKDMIIIPAIYDTSNYYIYKFEVSNFLYLQYLDDLQKTNKNDYNNALPDTLVWQTKLNNYQPFVTYYLRHPAYQNYPVVGLSYEQCNAFCIWLTKKYLLYEKRKFKNVVFRLPTKQEWMFAAKAGNEHAAFPFEKNSLQNERGEWLANFKVIPQDAIIENSGKYELNFNESKLMNHQYINITAPVKSYYPNKLGLYNMAGNVSEYVLEKGICKGGSWAQTAFYMQINREEYYDTIKSTSAHRGFRFVMCVEN